MAAPPVPALLLLLLLLPLLLPAQSRTGPTEPTESEPRPIPAPVLEGSPSVEGNRPLPVTELKAGALHPAPGRLALLASLAPRPVLV